MEGFAAPLSVLGYRKRFRVSSWEGGSRITAEDQLAAAALSSMGLPSRGMPMEAMESAWVVR